MLARRLIPLFALLALACAPMADPGPGGGGPGRNGAARLEVVGASALEADLGTELEVGFRYLDANGQTVEGALVRFAMTPAGSPLVAASAPTDADGVAYAMVRADEAGAYTLEARADDAEASATITVRAMARGVLEVNTRYDGARPVNEAELALFANASCEDLLRAVPTPEAVASVPVGGTATFENVALDVRYAVYALGIDGMDNVAAENCVSHTMTETHETLDADLADIAVRLGGPYATVETFDVTDGFSNDLDTLLHVAGGLGSDDPALWLVNEVRNAPGTPGWVRTALGSSVTRELAAGLLRDALADVHTPRELSEVVRVGADMDAAFSGMTLEGELTYQRPDEFGVAMSRHRINMLVVPLSDGEARLPQTASADVVVTFGDRIEMDEHALDLSFGQLVEIILSESILSRVSGRPGSLGELVAQQFDCPAIAARVGTGTTADIANMVCEMGVTNLRNRVDNAIRNLWDYDTLHLSGDSALTDTDGDYDYDAIEGGVARARWTGGSGELDFPGEFTGESTDDEPYRHPVRERMGGIL